jgi:hypothetical protein
MCLGLIKKGTALAAVCLRGLACCVSSLHDFSWDQGQDRRIVITSSPEEQIARLKAQFPS